MISALAEFIQIESPKKLDEIVASLNELVQHKVIAEVAGNFKLSDINTSQGYPDFIEIEFIEIATKYKFLLTVETYHGSGGYFKRIS